MKLKTEYYHFAHGVKLNLQIVDKLDPVYSISGHIHEVSDNQVVMVQGIDYNLHTETIVARVIDKVFDETITRVIILW